MWASRIVSSPSMQRGRPDLFLSSARALRAQAPAGDGDDVWTATMPVAAEPEYDHEHPAMISLKVLKCLMIYVFKY